MCRHQYPEQFVDRVGCVINALSESRSQSCCPTDSRGEQAPWSLPASSRASKAFGFRLADSSLNLANTTVKWKKPLPKTAASPQHTCLFMHNSQVQSLQRSVLDCLMIPLSSLGQSLRLRVAPRQRPSYELPQSIASDRRHKSYFHLTRTRCSHWMYFRYAPD
jgi:hypothetical protein